MDEHVPRLVLVSGSRMRLNTTLATIVTFVSLVFIGVSTAQAQCTLPYALTNGQIADASQVMANFNALANCLRADTERS
jgi:hypothetical protein